MIQGVFFSLGSWNHFQLISGLSARPMQLLAGPHSTAFHACGHSPSPSRHPRCFQDETAPGKAPSSLDLSNTKPAACPLCASAPQSKMDRP